MHIKRTQTLRWSRLIANLMLAKDEHWTKPIQVIHCYSTQLARNWKNQARFDSRRFRWCLQAQLTSLEVKKICYWLRTQSQWSIINNFNHLQQTTETALTEICSTYHKSIRWASKNTTCIHHVQSTLSKQVLPISFIKETIKTNMPESTQLKVKTRAHWIITKTKTNRVEKRANTNLKRLKAPFLSSTCH